MLTTNRSTPDVGARAQALLALGSLDFLATTVQELQALGLSVYGPEVDLLVLLVRVLVLALEDNDEACGFVYKFLAGLLKDCFLSAFPRIDKEVAVSICRGIVGTRREMWRSNPVPACVNVCVYVYLYVFYTCVYMCMYACSMNIHFR